jgi:hypothetical protein
MTPETEVRTVTPKPSRAKRPPIEATEPVVDLLAHLVAVLKESKRPLKILSEFEARLDAAIVEGEIVLKELRKKLREQR